MKKNFRGMTLAALLLSASTSAYADPDEYVHVGDSSQAFVGDLAGDDATVLGSPYAAPAAPIRNYAPVSVGDLQPAGFFDGGFRPSSQGCSSCDSPTCDGNGCDSIGGGGHQGRFGTLLNLCKKDGWIRAEGMVMFMAERKAPPLVTSSNPGTFPVLPDAVVEFGDELDGGVSGGFRADVGRYLTDHFGIGGRILWISDNGDDFSMSGNQNDANGRSIGRPYFFIPTTNPGIAREDAEIVSQLNLFSGRADAEFETTFVMAEAYARMTFCRNKASRLEMIGGYTYVGLDDNISITSVTTDLSNQTLPATVFSSTFDTENRFNGGQIGFESLVTRGRWSARALTKVHLGNMKQTVNISGYTEDFLAGNLIGRQNSSILVGEQQGQEEQNVFTFIPELDFTLGYRFRDHVSFTVGYTFMYFDSVAMAGDQIDRYRDTSNLGENVVPVGYDIVEGNHWVQGISLGASVDY
jgi:hypothetical protein